MTHNQRAWLSGLIVALTTGLGTAFSDASMSAVLSMQWSWKHCVGMALLGAISHVLLFLQKSPLPEEEK